VTIKPYIARINSTKEIKVDTIHTNGLKILPSIGMKNAVTRGNTNNNGINAINSSLEHR
jgi:hypothetical protein